MADHREQQRLAGAYFLIGLGAPIAVAFIYPLLMRGRRRGPLVEWETLSMPELTVFVVGAAIGIAMLVAGCLVLSRR